MLHVTSGDCAAELLRRAGLPGEVVAWRDSPAVGPAPGGVPPHELRALRAAFWGVPAEETQDAAALVVAADGGELVLWFDGCPWDQAMLIELLAGLAERPPAGGLSLLVIGEFPGVPGYAGLGQLTPDQLAPIFPTRQPVTPAQLDLARRTWSAHGAADPRGLAALLDEDTSPLPYLAPALLRLLKELPATTNGLARSEEQALRAVAAGARRFGEILRAVQSMERPNHGLWHGDSILRRTLETLASPPAPALAMCGSLAGDHPRLLDLAEVSLTPLGEALLAGRAEWVSAHGVDRWRGGVHLTGRGPVWRWDTAARAVVPPALTHTGTPGCPEPEAPR
jgi:hypothetical protein